MSAAEMVSDEMLQRRIRWQVLVDARDGAELWANLPADMTPTFERAVEASWTLPFHFSAYRQFEYRVCPWPTQTNLWSGVVRKMQRVVVLIF